VEVVEAVEDPAGILRAGKSDGSGG